MMLYDMILLYDIDQAVGVRCVSEPLCHVKLKGSVFTLQVSRYCLLAVHDSIRHNNNYVQI